jgi:hypothetical protein
MYLWAGLSALLSVALETLFVRTESYRTIWLLAFPGAIAINYPTRAVKLGPSGRRYKALSGSLLFFDVVFADGEGRPSTGGREIDRAPEDVLVVATRKVRELLSEQPRRDALERIHEAGDRDVRRILDQEMNMVFFAVDLAERGSEVPAHVLKDASHPFEVLHCEDMVAVFGYEDQMNVNTEDNMPAVSYVT